MKNKILQIIYDMRRQPVIAVVTFVATALSVFLIMVVVMMQRIQVIPISPESCRPRLLVGNTIHIKSDTGNVDSSGGMSTSMAKRLYSDLDGVEHTSFFTFYNENSQVKGTEQELFSAMGRGVDAEFFKIFDHKLVAGRYFTDDEVKSGLPLVILTESTARRAFGPNNPVGADIIINQRIFRVVGIVKDHTTLATIASGDLFINNTSINPDNSGERFGSTGAALLVKKGVDFEHIRNQVKARYAILDTELAPEDAYTVYHEAPYSIEVIASGISGSNVTPDTSGRQWLSIVIYAILFIVPAINLSSMLHSRLSQRIREFGVRRAFGCTRARIMTDIVFENFLVTLIGGTVGVIMGIIFASTYTGLYESAENIGRVSMPPVFDIIEPMTIVIAVGICFLLNILSASVPAWQASRLNPVNALNSK